MKRLISQETQVYHSGLLQPTLKTCTEGWLPMPRKIMMEKSVGEAVLRKVMSALHCTFGNVAVSVDIKVSYCIVFIQPIEIS